MLHFIPWSHAGPLSQDSAITPAVPAALTAEQAHQWAQSGVNLTQRLNALLLAGIFPFTIIYLLQCNVKSTYKAGDNTLTQQPLPNYDQDRTIDTITSKWDSNTFLKSSQCRKGQDGPNSPFLNRERQVPLQYNKTGHCKYPFWVTINTFGSKYHQGNPKALLINVLILKDKVASSLQTGFTLKTYQTAY